MSKSLTPAQLLAAYLMRGPNAAPRWLRTHPVGFAALWLVWIGLACLTWGANLLLPILADRRQAVPTGTTDIEGARENVPDPPGNDRGVDRGDGRGGVRRGPPRPYRLAGRHAAARRGLPAVCLSGTGRRIRVPRRTVPVRPAAARSEVTDG